MNSRIFLLLGSNEGQPVSHLAEAAAYIEAQAGTIITRSSVYRSAAWGFEQQPDFFNQVLEVTSPHAPELLLEKLLAIELKMGRIRHKKWGPRIIDIDLLFYGDEIRNAPSLQLPHPGIPSRRFTLLPLAEIAGEFIHPTLKKTVHALLEACQDNLRVEKIDISTDHS